MTLWQAEKVNAAVQEAAAGEGITRAEWIRRAIEERLERQKDK